MKTKYHIEITKKALEKHFSKKALKTIINANIQQDRLKYQVGHDHFHFDGCAFDMGFSYISKQQTQVINDLINDDFDLARKSFGKLLHSWQDFYSHSNYVRLWREKTGEHRPEYINHDDKEIFQDIGLKSGKNYGLIEFIAMIPLISKVIKPLMPIDSHAQMNLDSPTSGSNFQYAYWAALKRTYDAYSTVLMGLLQCKNHQSKIARFKDQ